MSAGPFAVLLCALTSLARAGVIHGIVLEHSSGRPLSRARVVLAALRSERSGTVAATLADRSGQFTFLSLPDGYYVLSAERIGFAVSAYGQKRNRGAGTPIAVVGDSVTFAEVRLRRLGAISGTILDENRVGMVGLTVIAYPAKLPLRMAGSTKSDDRGVYRISGLARGRHYVRTAAHELEDRTGLLPTFSPGTVAAKEARLVAVDLDQEAADVDVDPAPGRLLRLSGKVTGCRAPVTVVLSSDTGHKQTTVACTGDYLFEGLAPGDYELLAVHAPAEAPVGPGSVAAHFEIFLDRDREGANLQLQPAPMVLFQIETRDGVRLRPNEAPVMARRKDLAGEPEAMGISREAAYLLPGFWELTALPPPVQYLESIVKFPDRRRHPSRAGQNPDWHEIYLGPAEFPRVRVLLSSRAANLSGRVLSGGDPVAGAPVFLFPAATEVRRRVNGIKSTYTDPQGRYRFEGLAPGSYLVLSSFDLDEVSEDSLTAARAPTVTLDEGAARMQDLALYQAPP